MPRSRSALALTIVGVCVGVSLPAQDLQEHVSQQEQLLARHEWFKKVDYEIVRDHEPFVFYVQAPDKAKAKAGHVERVVRSYLAPMQHLERAFIRDYVRPLKLQPKRSGNFYAFAILSSEGDYVNYMKATQSADLISARAHYDPVLRLAVTYEETFGHGDRTRSQLGAILHEFVHALQHSYFAGHTFLPRAIWFTEGLAEYRSVMTGPPSSLDQPGIDEDHLALIVDLLRREDHGHCLNSVVDLVTTHGPGYQRIMDNAMRRSDGQPVLAVAQHAFYAQSSLFVHFLHTAKSSGYRPAFLRYTEAVMKGGSGWPVFTAAFEAVDPHQLEREFYDWVCDEFTRRNPGRALAPFEVELATVGDGAPRSAREASDKQPANEPAAASYADLDFTPEEWRLRLAAAVDLAGRGLLRSAEQLLRPADVDGSPGHQRLATEHRWVAGLLAFRTELFETLVETNGKVRLQVGEATVEGRVTGVSDHGITVASKEGAVSVAWSQMPADQIARQGRINRRLKGDAAWLDLYAALVSGRAPRGHLNRLLRGRGKQQRELAGYAKEYEELRELGGAAGAVAQLHVDLDSSDREAAARVVARLTELMDKHAARPFVASRRDALEAWGKQALESAFDPTDITSLGLRGRIDKTTGQRFRLRYDFKAPSQLDDFRESPNEAKERARGLESILAPDATGFSAGGGGLVCFGSGFRRLSIPIAAPFVVRYTVRFDKGFGWLYLNVCDDGFGEGRIETSPFGTLSVVDPTTGVAGSRQGELDGIFAGKPVKVEIHHDGKRVKSIVNGKKANEIAEVGTLTQGYLTLFVHSNEAIRLTDLEIEGAVDAKAMDAFRRQWVIDRLRQIFAR